MAKRRVKVRASTSNSVPSNDGASNPLQEEVTLPSPTMVNGGGAESSSEIKNVDRNTSEEGTKEEIPELAAKNGEVAIQEGGIDDTTNPLQEEITVPSPTMVKGEGTVVGSEIKNEEKHSKQAGTDEETAMLVVKNEEVSMKEVENETADDDKGKSKVTAFEREAEEKVFDKPNSAEEKDGEQMEIGGGGDYSEELDDYEEEDDDKDEDEGDGEDDEEAEEDEEEERMEIGEEEAGEEGEKEDENVEETLLVAKTEEKMEGKKVVESVVETVSAAKSEKKMEENSGGVAKKLVRSRLKKVGTKPEDKPTLSKEMVASTAADKPGASSQKKGIVEEGKSKVLSKKKAGTKAEDKSEASGKKKPPKRVKSMGLIFMCNSKTKQDCYRYKVLGLPASKKDLVQKVYKGMRLFLFDIDLRLMYGIYKAAGPGGYNIQPKAFDSAFPSQVRFTVIEDCLPLAEEKFKSILKDNYYAKKKFDCQLNSEQVKNLCKLFNSSGRISRLKNRKNVGGTESYPVADRARIERPMAVRERLGPGRIRRKRPDAESLVPRPRVGTERLGGGRIKRKRLDEESLERDRIRRQILDEERLDRDRIRRQREDEERLDRGRIRRQRLDEGSWDPRYHERPVVYESERYVSPLPPPSRAYDSYGRIAETPMYMREPVVDRRERVPVLEHRSGLPAVDHRDRRILDLDLRRRVEVGIRDPYASYREYNPPPRVQAAAATATTYLPLASSATEYRQREEAPAYEYGSLRSLYRY